MCDFLCNILLSSQLNSMVGGRKSTELLPGGEPPMAEFFLFVNFTFRILVFSFLTPIKN